MKKIRIYTNQNEISLHIKSLLEKRLKKTGEILVTDQDDFQYVITIGGDGTLLSAFHQYKDKVDQIQFIGIHTGHLGFYADWQTYELDELVTGLVAVSKDDYVTYPLLKVHLMENDKTQHEFLALNECSIRSTAGTIISQIHIKDQFFETLRSDGLCVATPTGSTGLNKSLGGAILHPRLDALQLTEIAPLNNRVYRSLGSPVIISKKEWFTIEPTISGGDNCFTFMYDNQQIPAIHIESLVLKIADQRIRFANIRHTHFWDRVESSFIGRKNREDLPLNQYLK
ncbi:TPA: NAD kinase [Streptococcus suis]